MTLAEAIKYRFLELLGEKNLSISEAARKADLSRATLNYALYSKRSLNYSIKTVEAMARGTGVSMTEFFNSDLFENIDFV